MSEENWVERRAKREKNLTNGASQLWEDAAKAIKACCESFSSHYRANSISVQGEIREGWLMITVARADGRGTEAQIQFSFNNEPRPCIRVKKITPQTTAYSSAGEVNQEFWIGSDEDHAFIEHQGGIISSDKLSEEALKDVFFPS
jgi:hypothetical protein